MAKDALTDPTPDRPDLRRVGQSVWDRIKSMANAAGKDPQYMLRRFAIERFLARGAATGHGNDWCLKGGMLMLALGDQFHRPTEDLDFTTLTPFETVAMLETMTLIAAAAPPEEDGLLYRLDERACRTMRDEAVNPGVRVMLDATLHGLRGTVPLRLKIDAAWGEAIMPGPLQGRLPPSCRGFEPPEIPVYPWETVVAEKLHTVLRTGLLGTRVKDIHDLVAIARSQALDGALLVTALRATFERRANVALLPGVPEGLSDGYAALMEDAWRKFVRAKGMEPVTPTILEAIREARSFAVPLLDTAADRSLDTPGLWLPGEGWHTAPSIAPR